MKGDRGRAGRRDRAGPPAPRKVVIAVSFDEPGPPGYLLNGCLESGRIANLVSARAKTNLVRIGWVYVAYHALVATGFVVSAIGEGSWPPPMLPLEGLFVVLVYPALIPALVVCGGLHDRCTTVLGHSVQATVFVTTAACYLIACWVLASRMGRMLRSNEGIGRD